MHGQIQSDYIFLLLFLIIIINCRLLSSDVVALSSFVRQEINDELINEGAERWFDTENGNYIDLQKIKFLQVDNIMDYPDNLKNQQKYPSLDDNISDLAGV